MKECYSFASYLIQLPSIYDCSAESVPKLIEAESKVIEIVLVRSLYFFVFFHVLFMPILKTVIKHLPVSQL